MTATCPVDADAVEQYHTQGFLVLRNVFSADEIAEASEEAERLLGLRDLIDSKNIRCRWQNHYQTSECRFDCFDPVIDLSPVMNRLARDPRLFVILEAIY